MDTYILHLGPLHVTIHEISQRHLWRILALPSDLQAPKVPEGYTHAQALDNVPDYAKAYEQYNTNAWFEQATRALGTARLLALQTDNGKQENEEIYRYCTLYTLEYPEPNLPAQRIGDLLWALADELLAGEGIGGADMTVEAFTWLTAKAGGMDQAAIDEAIKSLRRNRGRNASGEGVQDRQGAAQDGTGGASSQGESAVRHGERSKKLGHRAAKVSQAR